MRLGCGCNSQKVGGFPSRSPPPKQPFQPTPTPSPGSHQEVCERAGPWWAGPQALGARPQAPWRPGPQAPGAWIPPRRVFNFLLRLKPISPGLKTLGCYQNPQSADLGGRWMVSEGYSPMRARPGDLANKPLSPSPSPPSATIQHAPQGRRTFVKNVPLNNFPDVPPTQPSCVVALY